METESYLMVPVVPGGRTRTQGVDCWGLLVIVYHEKLHIELPIYEDVNWKDSTAVWLAIAENEKGSWREVAREDRAEYDVVTLRIKGIPWHVGVLVDRNRFVHADPVRGICVERLDSVHWRNRVVAYHRLKGDENVVPPAS